MSAALRCTWWRSRDEERLGPGLSAKGLFAVCWNRRMCYFAWWSTKGLSDWQKCEHWKTERDCYSGYCVIEFLHDAKLDAILEDAQ